MTPEEAIKCLDLISVLDAPGLKKGLEMAKEALEKQIPKKPIISEEQHIRYVTTFECPACNGKFTGFGVAKYCYRCGQAIDWSEGNKKCHFK